MSSKFSMFENLEPGAAPGSRLPHWHLSGGRQWQGVHTPSHALRWPCPARSCLVPAGPWGRRWENGCGCSRCIYWGLGEFCPETLSSRGWGVLHCSSKPNTPDIVPGSPDIYHTAVPQTPLLPPSQPVDSAELDKIEKKHRLDMIKVSLPHCIMKQFWIYLDVICNLEINILFWPTSQLLLVGLLSHYPKQRAAICPSVSLSTRNCVWYFPIE